MFIVVHESTPIGAGLVEAKAHVVDSSSRVEFAYINREDL